MIDSPRLHPPCPPRRRARPSATSCASVLVAVLAGLLAWRPPASAQASLDVTVAVPSAALPGEEVEILGQGFGGEVDALLAWVRTADGGVALEPLATAAGPGGDLLGVAVGAASGQATGSVEVWRGLRHAVPDQTLWSQGRLLTATGGSVFIAQETASGPAFSVLAGAPEVLAGRFDGSWVVVDLAELEAAARLPLIRLTVVMETKSGCGQDVTPRPTGARGTEARARRTAPPPRVDRQSGDGPRWALDLTVQLDAPMTSAAALAAALAELLNELFGSLGLSASANGSVLTICSVGCLDHGFATLVFD